MNFNDVEEVLAALCLLRSSPNLQELEVLVSFFLLIMTLASSKLTLQAHAVKYLIFMSCLYFTCFVS